MSEVVLLLVAFFIGHWVWLCLTVVDGDIAAPFALFIHVVAIGIGYFAHTGATRWHGHASSSTLLLMLVRR